MSSNPLSDWLALSKSSMAMFKQLAEAGQASLRQAGEHTPPGQAQAAHAIKAALDMGAQWKALQGEAFTSLLHGQIDAYKAHQESRAAGDFAALRESLTADLAERRQAALKAVSERGAACLGDLRKASSKDDIAIVVACFIEDVGATFRENAEQTFTLLNSASAAATVLTHKALDAAIDADKPPA